MPDRIIRAGILTSEAVNSLSWPAEVFYRRLMSVVDDYGRYDGRSSILRAQLYPLHLDRVDDAAIQAWLKETVEAGLVRAYTVHGKAYIEILKFNQRMRTKASKWPAPADNGGQLRANDSKCPPLAGNGGQTRANDSGCPPLADNGGQMPSHASNRPPSADNREQMPAKAGEMPSPEGNGATPAGNCQPADNEQPAINGQPVGTGGQTPSRANVGNPRAIVSTVRPTADNGGQMRSESEAEAYSESYSKTEAEAGAEVPAVGEVIDFGQGGAGIPEEFCRHYHAVCDEQHRWIRNGQLISWRKEIVRWWSRDRATWNPKGEAQGKPQEKPRKSVWDIKVEDFYL